MPRPGRHPEGGFTLVEVTVTSAILVIVIAILAPILTGSLTTFERQTDRSGALDQADLVLQQIQHDVYGSSVISVVSNNQLDLITVLPNTADTKSCIEYRLTTGAAPAPLALQRQAWTAPGVPSSSGWQTLLAPLRLSGSGQQPGYVIPNPAGATPFTASGSQGQSVLINVAVQNGTSTTVNNLTTTATGVTANPSGAAAAATTWSSQC